MFLVKVFTEGKKVVGKAFFLKERFIGTIIGMLLGSLPSSMSGCYMKV